MARRRPIRGRQTVSTWRKFLRWTGITHKKGVDWLEWIGVLFIPIILFGASTNYNNTQLNNARDQQQESILDTYQKDIAGLILTQPLDTSPQGLKGRQVAKAFTTEAILRLDPNRKGRLIQFLYGAQLLQTDHPAVDLNGTDLSGANLSKMVLST